jgi:hypothetical protein
MSKAALLKAKLLMSENAALDIVRQFKFENAQLGVVLALIGVLL